MTKSASGNSLQFPFLLLPQMGMNGELPINALFQFARSQARFASMCGDEVARFAEHRLERDQEFLTGMTDCQDWATLGELQTAWAMDVVKDYVQQSGHIFGIFQNLSSEVTASPSEKAKPKTRPKRATAA